MTSAPPKSRMSVDRQAELFAVVLDLLLEVGYERLTLDAVAARAHTSKATLYRLWDGKPGLVMAALRHKQPPKIDHSEAGSLNEVFELMARGAGDLAGRDMQMAFTLMRAASADDEFRLLLRETFLDPSVETLTNYFDQAADRGEIVRDPALFRRLVFAIIEHFVLLGMFNAEPDTVETRRAFFDAIIRPALTFTTSN